MGGGGCRSLFASSFAKSFFFSNLHISRALHLKSEISKGSSEYYFFFRCLVVYDLVMHSVSGRMPVHIVADSFVCYLPAATAVSATTAGFVRAVDICDAIRKYNSHAHTFSVGSPHTME